MNAALDQLFESRGLEILEAELAPSSPASHWSSVVTDATGFPLSGGIGRDREAARKIAVSEAVERLTFFNLRDSDAKTRAEWGLDTHPTACGFAAGFDLVNTISRSLSEAIERWVMSMWIDEQLQIEEILPESVTPQLDSLSIHFASQFDSIRYFYKAVLVDFLGCQTRIAVAQTMGIKGQGIFPGSSAQISEGAYWQHSLLESYRHLQSIKNNLDRGDRFPDNRVKFFSKNSHLAEQQIAAATRSYWPIPRVKLHRVIPVFDSGIYVARTVIDGWRSWSDGPITRFLY